MIDQKSWEQQLEAQRAEAARRQSGRQALVAIVFGVSALAVGAVALVMSLGHG